MRPTPQASAARDEILWRLALYRERRASLHRDIHRAAEFDLSVTEIAKASGMSWHGVKKILDRPTKEEEA